MKRSARLRVDAALDALYGRVPELDCRGLCYSSCGPIECSERERGRLAEAGVALPTLAEYLAQDRAGQTITCPALALGRCTAYEVRPMLCRIWGAADGLPCPHGCRPLDGGRLLTDAEAYELLGDSLAVGGLPGGLDPATTGATMRAWIEEHPAEVDAIQAHGRAADRRRAVPADGAGDR